MQFNFPKHFISMQLNESSKKENDTNFVEIAIRNNKFNSTRRRLIKLAAFTTLSYLILNVYNKKLHYTIHAGFILSSLILVYFLLNVVEMEVVKVLKDFVLQYSTHYSFGRQKSIFIPSSNIYKIVINEVIYFVSIF